MNAIATIRRRHLVVWLGAVLSTVIPLSTSALAAVSVAEFTNEWRPFGLQGLIVRSLAATTDRLCAGTQGQGVFCLDLLAPHGGWKELGPAGTTITGIWIDRYEPQVMFAASGSHLGGPTEVLLYRTGDGGGTWEPADLDLRRQGAQAIDVVDGVPTLPILGPIPIPFPVYAAGDGVWRSDDRGFSWQKVLPFPIEVSLEVSPTDLLRTVWAGGETFIFSGFTVVSHDGGATWQQVWDSNAIGDNQTADIAAHPVLDGTVLTGHEGFVLKTTDFGQTFYEVLAAPARFFLDWDRANPSRAYAAGSGAFFSSDLGEHWVDITGNVLGPRTIARVQADVERLGVVYAATADGVYRHYGGGVPMCMVATGDELQLAPGVCPPILAPIAELPGDAIVVDLDQIRSAGDHIDLGEVECLIDDRGITFVTIDTPDPAPGKAIGILARAPGATDYGPSSDGLPRIPSQGDCP